jgi:uncharacterized protein (DUF169 family)
MAEVFTRSLNLRWSPVAMAFMSDPPPGLSRIDRPLPAGCAYWKHASERHQFYTLAEDHDNLYRRSIHARRHSTGGQGA